MKFVSFLSVNLAIRRIAKTNPPESLFPQTNTRFALFIHCFMYGTIIDTGLRKCRLLFHLSLRVSEKSSNKSSHIFTIKKKFVDTDFTEEWNGFRCGANKREQFNPKYILLQHLFGLSSCAYNLLHFIFFVFWSMCQCLVYEVAMCSLLIELGYSDK